MAERRTNLMICINKFPNTTVHQRSTFLLSALFVPSFIAIVLRRAHFLCLLLLAGGQMALAPPMIPIRNKSQSVCLSRCRAKFYGEAENKLMCCRALFGSITLLNDTACESDSELVLFSRCYLL